MNFGKIILVTFFIIGSTSILANSQALELPNKLILAENTDELNIPSFLDSEEEKPTKSKLLAVGLSLLLPGAGQYYQENKSRAIFFGSTEAVIWSGFLGFRLYGSWKKDDYRAWASFNAGADVDGKDDRFFEKMTYYDSRDEFNQLETLFEGENAVIFPNSPDYFWNWESDQARAHYRDLRNQSKNAFRRSLLFLGVATANRIISAIDAFRTSGKKDSLVSQKQVNVRPYYSMYNLMGSENLEIGISIRF